MNSLAHRLLYFSTTFFLSEAPVLAQSPYATGWGVSDIVTFLADGKVNLMNRLFLKAGLVLKATADCKGAL